MSSSTQPAVRVEGVVKRFGSTILPIDIAGGQFKGATGAMGPQGPA